jgi:hypothetical protein
MVQIARMKEKGNTVVAVSMGRVCDRKLRGIERIDSMMKAHALHERYGSTCVGSTHSYCCRNGSERTRRLVE